MQEPKTLHLVGVGRIAHNVLHSDAAYWLTDRYVSAGFQDGAFAGRLSQGAVSGHADGLGRLSLSQRGRLLAVHLSVACARPRVPGAHCRDLAGHG